MVRELEAVGGLTESAIAQVARRHGLSHAALNALAIIEGNDGPLPAGTVGARMHITSGSVTSVLDTLERNGFVVRLTDPEDRRRVLVDVTPTARALLDQVLPEVVQTATALVGAFPAEELDALLATLARVRQAIADLPQDLGPPAPRRRPTAPGPTPA